MEHKSYLIWLRLPGPETKAWNLSTSIEVESITGEKGILVEVFGRDPQVITKQEKEVWMVILRFREESTI